MSAVANRIVCGLMIGLLLLAHGCGGHTANSASSPASQNACLKSCGWPTLEATRCAQTPGVLEYDIQVIKPIWEAMQRLGGLPDGECVCFRVRLSADGTLSDVVVARSTSERAAELITEAVHAASPVPPVPFEAACILEAPFNPQGMAYGG